MEDRVREDGIDFQELVEWLPAVVYVSAPGVDAPALYVSSRVESMLGYARKEWLSEPGLWAKLLHPDDRERTFAEAVRAREAGEAFGIEYRMVAKDGRVVWVRDEAAPVLDEEGRPDGWRGVLLDITVRKRYEAELRESEERHRLVARATGEAIWDNDLLTGVQEWAGATEALFGYAPHRGKTGLWWEERIHPEDKERVLSSLEALYEGAEEEWSEEYRFLKADGSFAQVKDRGYVVRDGDGEPVRMVGSMADITERKRWEETLKESEERFRMTFEVAAVGMAHVAPNDYKWIRINPKLCEIFGYEREELLGLTFLDLTLPEDLEASLDRVHRMLEGELGPYSIERRYVRKDGYRIWTQLTVSLVRTSSGEPDYFVAIVEDITERKRAELVREPLTDGEMDVLRLVALGQTNREISRGLGYSVGTINSRVVSILSKLGAKNRREAARRAVHIGLLPSRAGAPEERIARKLW